MARPPRVNILARIVVIAAVLISATLVFAIISQVSAQSVEPFDSTAKQAPLSPVSLPHPFLPRPRR